MLSILIPVYKQEISIFVEDLFNAAQATDIKFEIIVMVDGYKEEFNKLNPSLLPKNQISVIYLDDNVGRSRIRNKLAEEARFEHLLFLDADGKLINNQFIHNYLSFMNSQDVISGGRIYQDKKPTDSNFILHWLYGIKLESRPAKFRNQNPALFFHSNNFLVTKSTIRKIPFDETITQYGYEDLFWAKQLESNNVKITYIDNPVIHLGLENSEVFLTKIDQSLENLKKLSERNKEISWPLHDIYNRIKNWGINNFSLKIFLWIKNRMLKNLKSNRPSLLILKAYKLGRYLEILSRN